MSRLIILLLLSLIGNSIYASENKIEMEANINNISSCLFTDEGLASDGKNIFHKLTYLCSDGVNQETVLFLNDKSLKGSDVNNTVNFKIDNLNNKNVVFSEFFMIIY